MGTTVTIETSIRAYQTYYPKATKSCYICSRDIPPNTTCYHLTRTVHAHKECWEAFLEAEKSNAIDETCEVGFELAKFPSVAGPL